MSDRAELDFTGERMVPGQVPHQLEAEHRARYRYAARLFRPGRILDDGCGAGYGSLLLARAGCDVTGVDVSHEAVAHCEQSARAARAGHDSPRFLQADSSRLPFADGHFDGVVSFEVVEHLDDYEAYVREAARVLAPAGRLLISTPNKRVYTDLSPNEPNHYHVHEFYPEEFRELLACHFDEVELLIQTRVSGMYIGPAVSRTTNLPGSWLLPDAGEQSAIINDAEFVVALCRKRKQKESLSVRGAARNLAPSEFFVTERFKPRITHAAVDGVRFDRGFHADEAGSRWMKRKGTVTLAPDRFSGGGGADIVRFDLVRSACSHYESFPFSVTVRPAGAEPMKFRFDEATDRIAVGIEVGGDSWWKRRGLEISLESAQAFTPAERGIGADLRELSVRLVGLVISAASLPASL